MVTASLPHKWLIVIKIAADMPSVWGPSSEVAAEPLQRCGGEEWGATWPRSRRGPRAEDLRCRLSLGAGEPLPFSMSSCWPPPLTSSWSQYVLLSRAAQIALASICIYLPAIHHHQVEQPLRSKKCVWQKLLSKQRKRAVVACFRMAPLYNLPRYESPFIPEGLSWHFPQAFISAYFLLFNFACVTVPVNPG